MLKTVVVSVVRVKKDRKYKRRYRVSKNYKAHVDTQDFNIGDTVLIEECRPISKDKNWKVIKKISSAEIVLEEKEPETEEQTKI